MLSKCIIVRIKGAALTRAVELAVLASICWLWPEPLIGRALVCRPDGSIVAKSAGSSQKPVDDSFQTSGQARTREASSQGLGSEARAAAERSSLEAEKLWREGTAESRHKAIDKYNETLSLWNTLGDHSRDASILNSVGWIHYELGENRKALEVFDLALAAADKANDSKEKAEALNRIAVIYDTFGQKDKAIQTYDQALSLFKSIADRYGEGQVLGNKGLVYWSMRNSEKALDYFTQALSIRREIGDRTGESNTLNSLGVVHAQMGEQGEALQYYDQALSLQRRLGLKMDVARTLNNIGYACVVIGEYQDAFRAYDEALPIRRATGDRRGEGYTLENIGDLRNVLGDYEGALKYYELVLPIAREVGDKQLEAATLVSQGWAYAMVGQYSKTLDCYDHSLALSQKSGVPNVEVLNKLGIAYRAMKENDKALEYYSKALALSRSTRDRSEEAMSLSLMADIYLSQSKIQEALDYYSQALSIERSMGQPVSLWTLSGMARAQAAAGNLKEALATMELAIAQHESDRKRAPSRDLRASALSDASTFYEEYVELLMKQHSVKPDSGYDVLALQASERGKARGLVDSLAESAADIRQGVDADLLARERGIERRLSEREAYRTRLFTDHPHNDNRTASLDKELGDLVDQLHNVQAEIRATSPAYAALTQPSPLTVPQIQRQLLDDNTILLEYSLGRERSFLWVITTHSVTSFELGKRSEIDAAARKAYELVTQSNQRIHKRDAEVALAELGGLVLGPAAEVLGRKRLLIVPDGGLHYVPFEALPEPGGPAGRDAIALIANHEVTYLPSASVLAELRRITSGRRTEDRTVAVLADPVFGDNDPRVSRARRIAAPDEPAAREARLDSGLLRSIGETGGSLERLPFARREAEAILRLLDGSGLAALDFKANRATATSPDLGRYRVVHFATHALINSKHPDLSGIVLSLVDQQGNPQDGFLAAHDIYNLKLGADLVVLSACSTALGKEMKGEGLVSIVRGFMYAGAPRVVASLWDERDEAAAELMKRFYQGFLKDGLAPAAALRAAKTSMRKEKRWESPYYWAGFVLQGEWK